MRTKVILERNLKEINLREWVHRARGIVGKVGQNAAKKGEVTRVSIRNHEQADTQLHLPTSFKRGGLWEATGADPFHLD